MLMLAAMHGRSFTSRGGEMRGKELGKGLGGGYC